jgi:hypothetical protein
MHALDAHSARAIVNDRQRQYDPDRRSPRRPEPRLRLVRRAPRR